MRIATVLGARPQFIKAAAVSRALAAVPGLRQVLIHTGQHYDENLSAIFFRELGLPAPDHHLGIGSGRHGAQTGRMLVALEETLIQVQPDWVLVYGDTNSTLAGALAAVKLHLPVAHVEAGLRSGNRQMPEEINRVLTDHAADLLFTPTAAATANLAREGLPPQRVHQVGDVMYDVALNFAARAELESGILQRLHLRPGAYVLATVHRAENTDDPARLAAILAGLGQVAAAWPVVLPLHPRTGAAMARHGLGAAAAGLALVDPVGYLDMVMLERHARLIATDSGGVQKEAFFFQTPCVTLRTETEWGELITSGWNHLVPPASAAAVAAGVTVALAAPPGQPGNPYGDGHAALRIVRALTGGHPG